MAPMPLLEHVHEEATAFGPEDLVASVRALRALPRAPVPEVCVLEFDGDLHDRLVASGEARPWENWACFHTKMVAVDVDGRACGLVARTIGGPYAVLVAEQLVVSGARVVLGLTSAGRIGAPRRLPHLVVVEGSIRDEGTSHHYLPPSRVVDADGALATALAESLASLPLPLHRGLAWTTDAPYRETRSAIAMRAAEGAVCVEMQAASLFAFARARGAHVGVVAYVTNAVDAESEPFDKGEADLEREVLLAACRGAFRYLDARDA